jgi:hypothetical protein
VLRQLRRRFPRAYRATLVVACYDDACHATLNPLQVVFWIKLSPERVVDQVHEFRQIDAWVVRQIDTWVAC